MAVLVICVIILQYSMALDYQYSTVYGTIPTARTRVAAWGLSPFMRTYWSGHDSGSGSVSSNGRGHRVRMK